MAKVSVPLEQRFWAKVDKRGPNECWLWTGGLAEAGEVARLKRLELFTHNDVDRIKDVGR